MSLQALRWGKEVLRKVLRNSIYETDNQKEGYTRSRSVQCSKGDELYDGKQFCLQRT